ncbi:MAG: hypothetical protein GC136_01105 [Alphaproteobacteria bacterium]|nr:hypothetical protein [Alphaproteobacteria bacterium]
MDKKWLETQFELNPQKSKAGLADAAGLAPSAISKILGGIRQIKAAEYIRMRTYFGLPNDGALEGKSPILPPNGLAEGQNEDVSGAFTLPNSQNKLIIESDDMAPDLKTGDVAFYSAENDDLPGLFVLEVRGQKFVRYCESADGGKIRVTARNPLIPPVSVAKSQLTILGKIYSRLQKV